MSDQKEMSYEPFESFMATMIASSWRQFASNAEQVFSNEDFRKNYHIKPGDEQGIVRKARLDLLADTWVRELQEAKDIEEAQRIVEENKKTLFQRMNADPSYWLAASFADRASDFIRMQKLAMTPLPGIDPVEPKEPASERSTMLDELSNVLDEAIALQSTHPSLVYNDCSIERFIEQTQKKYDQFVQQKAGNAYGGLEAYRDSSQAWIKAYKREAEKPEVTPEEKRAFKENLDAALKDGQQNFLAAEARVMYDQDLRENFNIDAAQARVISAVARQLLWDTDITAPRRRSAWAVKLGEAKDHESALKIVEQAKSAFLGAAKSDPAKYERASVLAFAFFESAHQKLKLESKTQIDPEGTSTGFSPEHS